MNNVLSIDALKTYTVRLTYLGITAEIKNVKDADVADAFQTLDTEMGANVEIAKYANQDGEGNWHFLNVKDMWKWSGRQVITGGASFTTFEDWGNWHGGEAYETGILSEGLGATGFSKETFDSLNELLAAAGEKPLSMLDEAGEVVDDESDADWNRTLLKFDADANEEALKMLDEATWEVEASGDFDEDALLGIIKNGDSLESDANGTDEEELALTLIEVAEKNGYTHVATLSEEGDTFYAEFEEPASGVEDWSDFHEIPSTVSIQFRARDSWGQNETYASYVFCEDSKLEAAREAWTASDSIFFGKLKADFEENGWSQSTKIESDEDFEAFGTGTGTWDGFYGFVMNVEEDTYYAKVIRNDEATIYERNSAGDWIQR